MDGTPHVSNNRYASIQICKQMKDHDAWFGFEQEYMLFELDNVFGQKPYRWNNPRWPSKKIAAQTYPVPLDVSGGTNMSSAPSYCGVGGDRIFGRNIVEKHMEYCLYAGIKICGINFEVAPSQAEFQIGICSAEEVGDHLWMARYILCRVAEEYGAHVEFAPKSAGEHYNGSGCHVNFSTSATRRDGGLDAIIEMCKKMEPDEMRGLHLQAYGDETNKARLTGAHETARYDEFTYGFSDRGCSVRIPYTTHNAKKGYMEDRRPAANCDPYKVVTRLLQTLNQT